MEFNQDIKLLIDGKWIQSSERDSLPLINPATEEILSNVPIANDKDLDNSLTSSHKAFKTWSKFPPLKRQSIMLKAVEIIKGRQEEIAKTLTMEMGKTLRESRQEINQVIETTVWCAEEGKRTYGRIIPSRDSQARQMVFKEQIGRAHV